MKLSLPSLSASLRKTFLNSGVIYIRRDGSPADTTGLDRILKTPSVRMSAAASLFAVAALSLTVPSGERAALIQRGIETLSLFIVLSAYMNASANTPQGMRTNKTIIDTSGESPRQPMLTKEAIDDLAAQGPFSLLVYSAAGGFSNFFTGEIFPSWQLKALYYLPLLSIGIAEGGFFLYAASRLAQHQWTLREEPGKKKPSAASAPSQPLPPPPVWSFAGTSL